jgi:transposase-like protein
VFPARALYLIHVRNVLAADVGDDELVSVWMRPEFIDAVARRVVQLCVGADSDKQRPDGELLTVSEVARRLNVSPHWVYAHKRDLGVIRLGDGPKARLRFHLAAVLAELDRRSESPRSDGNGDGEARKRTRRRLISTPLPRASRTA